MKYTLTVLIEEMNEPSYEITYTPDDDDDTTKVLERLPDYFAEPLSFQSDAVSAIIVRFCIRTGLTKLQAGQFYWKITQALHSKK